ncbi:MAG TPA: carbon storage regulator CsrA [Solirubrobacteraceae bacterium]|jgi:carbon storage regulator|nr:carbon storage regulator CsrA [Solirubrobacteraceae bacterium]
MLVLTRKSNQSIMIGDNIEVSVLAIMGEKVRIGIQADRNVPVFRKEVYLEIQAERENEGTEDADAGSASTNAEQAGTEQTTPRAAANDGAGDTSADAEQPRSGAERNGRREVDAALRTIGGESK